MDVLSATKARANLFRLIDETAEAHKQVLITGQRNNAVLVSQEDWNAIQETLYLASIPGMAESIIESGQTPVEECINLEELKLGLASSADETSS
ncbi:type II toxin-antitoxin system Phd/YefM family antitoxin [Chlorogloea sp. CCALA 695]|uniref:type II toxin-antitoxin system Phd/YefM family antitoxin n=1 Tax=Chlorogloea sp. CCALA 695 TaxID=2107693 RepID=UPI000D05C00E|nr:type II toxin-antitoxin system Phd/YefM family antitoxin [Chlorogloea sp. CCALA 695]PSB25145.1 prevent-host-death protein [Chlorogloea sp. CCALA 695]